MVVVTACVTVRTTGWRYVLVVVDVLCCRTTRTVVFVTVTEGVAAGALMVLRETSRTITPTIPTSAPTARRRFTRPA